MGFRRTPLNSFIQCKSDYFWRKSLGSSFLNGLSPKSGLLMVPRFSWRKGSCRKGFFSTHLHAPESLRAPAFPCGTRTGADFPTGMRFQWKEPVLWRSQHAEVLGRQAEREKRRNKSDGEKRAATGLREGGMPRREQEGSGQDARQVQRGRGSPITGVLLLNMTSKRAFLLKNPKFCIIPTHP